MEPQPASPEFRPYPKLGRFSRDCVITEKIDGTNAQILITEDGQVRAGSRNRWLTLEDDNFGFARWVEENKGQLLQLGPGRHFGEWWGSGIQRGYGLSKGEKRFSLFNVERWKTVMLPSGVFLVPILWMGNFNNIWDGVDYSVQLLRKNGSQAAPFLNPEGIVIFHTAAQVGFKKTLVDDDKPKSLVK